MVAGKHRSRSLRRVYVKTPGGRTVLHYRRRKPQGAKCANCKKNLLAVPREIVSVLRNISKSSKRPERPYGGYYCSACTREHLKTQARVVRTEVEA